MNHEDRGLEMKNLVGRFFVVFVFAVIFCLTQNSFAEDIGVTKKEKAEEVKSDELELEPIVVTATRTEKGASSAPGSISVVTKKDIEKRNIQTIDQALSTLPGVYNTRVRLMDISPAITLRGMPYGLGRTLVLMDGINLVDPMLGNLYGFAGIEPDEVERIEVVKGPFSSLYGGQAMGGVVNIIKKTPEKREFTVKGGYGTSWHRGEAADDLKRFYVSYGDKFMDKLSLFLSYGRQDTNGFPTIYNVQRTQPPAGISGWSDTTDTARNPRFLIGDKGDTSWTADNITVKASYDFSETSKLDFSFYRTWFKTHYDAPHTYLKDAAGNPVWSYGSVPESSFLNYHDMYREQYFYNASYETVISSVKSKLSLNYVDSSFGAGIPGGASTRSGGAGSEWENPYDRNYNTELLFTTPPLFNRHILTFGGFLGHNAGQMDEYGRTNWKDEGSRTDLTYRSKGKDRTFAIFAQDEIMILDNLTLYVGVREDWWKTYDGYVFQLGAAGYPIDYDSNSESSFSPKASLVYNPFNGTTFRVSAGKAFRTPTIVELYRTWTAPNGITYAGNPNIEPETTISWDIGAEQALWKGAKIKATYFENYMKDFISRAMTSATLYENKNIAKAESRGVELEAEQSLGNWLRFYANFTYTDSEITENDSKPTTVGKSLTMLPDRMFNIGVDLSKGPFLASIISKYVSKVYKNDDNSDKVSHVYSSYDPYYVTDVKLSYNIMNFAKLSFSVDNIFNEDYFYSDKAPGRSWFTELAFKF